MEITSVTHSVVVTHVATRAAVTVVAKKLLQSLLAVVGHGAGARQVVSLRAVAFGNGLGDPVPTLGTWVFVKEPLDSGMVEVQLEG